MCFFLNVQVYKRYVVYKQNKKKSEEVFLHTANTHGMNGWNLVKMCKVPLTRIINAISNSMLTMMVKQALKKSGEAFFLH